MSMRSEATAGADQMHSCLQQLAAGAAASSTQDSSLALDALFQVQWFQQFAAEAATQIQVSADGQLVLPAGLQVTTSQPQQEWPQQQASNAAEQQSQQLSLLLATLLAKLSQQHAGVCNHLLQVLLLQLLHCQHNAADSNTNLSAASHTGSTSSRWVSVLCKRAADLHVQGNPSAQQLAATCVQQLEQSLSDVQSTPHAAGQMTVGQQVCLQLLAALLPSPSRHEANTHSPGGTAAKATEQQGSAATAAGDASVGRGLQPELLQRLLDCVVPKVALGHPLSKALQTSLVAPLMAAAAAAAAAAATAAASAEAAAAGMPLAAYHGACVQLLYAVCGSSGDSQLAAAAAAATGCVAQQAQQRDGRQVSESLALACRLQAHLLVACQTGGGGCAPLLHALLQEGLLHGDLHCRQRAVHLLEACVAAGCAPKVLNTEQWHSYIMLYKAEEQHMLHLIQPLWAQCFKTLWQGADSSSRSSTGSQQGQQQQQQQQQEQQQQLGELVRWCSVLVLRAAFHPNVGVKRLGLSGLLNLSTTTLKTLMAKPQDQCTEPGSPGPGHTPEPGDPGAWPVLQDLLLQLLPAFGDRKLVSQAAGGSASSRQAEAVAALQQQLGGFVGRCIQLLQQQWQESAPLQLQQQQQQQVLLCQPVQQLLVKYIEQATAVGDKAATLLFLLQALANGITTAAAASGGSNSSTTDNITTNTSNSSSSSSTCSSSGNQELLGVLVRTLAHAEFVHPAYLRPQICRTVLQIVPYCVQSQAAGSAAVLSLLAACSPLVLGSSGVSGPVGSTVAVAAAADGGSFDGIASDQQQQQQVLAAGGFLDWLPAAIVTTPDDTPPAAAAAAAAMTAGGVAVSIAASRGQQPSPLEAVLLSASGTGSTAAAQQHYAALYCLGMLAPNMGAAAQQQLAGALSAATAAAVTQQGCSAQHHQQQQLHGQLTAAAWFVAGVITALWDPTPGGQGAAAVAGPQLQQQQQQNLLATCASDMLPVLLEHHLIACCTTAHTYDPYLCEAVVAAVSAAASASADTQLQAVLHQHLSGCRDSLAPWLHHATQPSVSLHEQLLLLTSVHVACFALQPTKVLPTDSSSSSSINNINIGCNQTVSIPSDVIEVCLQLLCQLTPSATVSSAAVQVDGSSNYSSKGSSSGNGGSSSSGSSLSKMELTDKLLQLHASVLDQLVSAAGAARLSEQTRRMVFTRCLEDLEWTSQQTLTQLLHTLLLTAPFTSTTHAPSTGVSQAETCSEGSAADTAADGQCVGELQVLLQHFQALVRSSSKRFSAGEVSLLAKVFFHPALFQERDLLPMLCEQLIPSALTQGGVRLSVGVMSHLCYAVLGSQPQLLQELLPHITHMAAFSVFSNSVTQAAALQQQKCDVAVLLPSRVVLSALLVQMASSGVHADFTSQLTDSLLTIAQAAPGSPYAWLGSREASQSSGTNAIRVSVWQALCLLAPYMPQEQLQQVLQQGWSCLLCSHQHGNIRPHVQLFLLVLFSRHPAAVHELLLPALNSFNTTSYQVTVSVIILGMFVLLELGPSSAHFLPLLHALLPWALHHRHAVRIPVQVMLHVTFKRHMSAIQDSLGAEATQLLAQVRRFLAENDEVSKLRERQGLVDLEHFNLQHETSLQGVFGVRQDQLDSLCDGESDSTGLQWPLHVRDRLPLDLLSCLPGAVKAVGDRKGAPAAAAAGGGGEAAPDGSAADAGAAGGKVAGAADDADAAEGLGDGAEGGAQDGAAVMYQFRPQIQGSLFDDAAADRADALVADRASKPGLILCASLLENLPNLAGLCRTCESMSAEALVVASRAVVQTDAFKKQSRTSERWLRILEVGLHDMATYLQEQRAAGYTIIGVEQATNSVALQSYKFPKRCVLVLGNEQSGMPAAVLPLLDVCVEIPMLGVTRSLNAHVSGAMVLWQYTQQHLQEAC